MTTEGLNKDTDVHILSQEEETAINIARGNIKSGNSYIQKEVDERLKKWQ